MTSGTMLTLSFPASTEEATQELARLAADGAALAGGTWVMRGPLRGEPLKPAYVALKRIPELSRVEVAGSAVLGAMVTHERLARLDESTGPLGCQAISERALGAPRRPVS